MTVKQSPDPDNSGGSDLLKPKEFSSIEDSMDSEKTLAAKRFFDREVDRKSMVRTELETESESNGSSEEMESPTSVVAKVGEWSAARKIAYVHNQILRVREEDSHIGKEIGEGLSAKEKLSAHHVAASHVDLMLFSRPILPASPLSGKTPFKSTVH